MGRSFSIDLPNLADFEIMYNHDVIRHAHAKFAPSDFIDEQILGNRSPGTAANRISPLFVFSKELENM